MKPIINLVFLLSSVAIVLAGIKYAIYVCGVLIISALIFTFINSRLQRFSHCDPYIIPSICRVWTVAFPLAGYVACSPNPNCTGHGWQAICTFLRMKVATAAAFVIGTGIDIARTLARKSVCVLIECCFNLSAMFIA